MLKHIMLLKAKPGINQAAIDEIFIAIDALKRILPGIMSFSYGMNHHHESKEQGYTHVYSMDFVDSEYYQNYVVHPRQQSIQEKIKNILVKENSQLIVNYNLSLGDG